MNQLTARIEELNNQIAIKEGHLNEARTKIINERQNLERIEQQISDKQGIIQGLNEEKIT